MELTNELIKNIQIESVFTCLIIVIVLATIDFITGVVNAWIKNEPSSKKMREGLGKKVAEIVYVILGIIAKYVFGTNVIAIFITFYIGFMELISISENCDKLGVKMPKCVKDKMNNLNEELNSKNKEDK